MTELSALVVFCAGTGVHQLASELHSRGIDKDESTYVRLAEVHLQEDRVEDAMGVLDEVERQVGQSRMVQRAADTALAF